MNTPIDSYLQKRRAEKDILLMTHIVLGYPSWETCLQVAGAMVEAGVDLMELQIPFSEPLADGPVILRANQKALGHGCTVKDCLDFAQEAARRFDIPFFIMSYYNILFKYGVERFTRALAERSLQGAIVPDLPPEEGQEYLRTMKQQGLSPILFFFSHHFGQADEIHCFPGPGLYLLLEPKRGHRCRHHLFLRPGRLSDQMPPGHLLTFGLGFWGQGQSGYRFFKGKSGHSRHRIANDPDRRGPGE